MIYDVTDPANATFVGYKPPLPPTAQPSPDNAPETIKFISAADSPTGTALVVTANEVGNATTVYAVGDADLPNPGDRPHVRLDGQSVSTTGVVTAVDSNGFYIQDPNGDGNAATSDGIFVFTSVGPDRRRRPGSDGDRHGRPSSCRAARRRPASCRSPKSSAPNTSVSARARRGDHAGRDRRCRQPRAADQRHQRRRGVLRGARRHAGQGERSGRGRADQLSNGEIFTVVDNDDNAANGLNATGLTAARHAPVHAGDGGAGRSAAPPAPTRCERPTPPAVISIPSASRSTTTAACSPGSSSPDVNPGAHAEQTSPAS